MARRQKTVRGKSGNQTVKSKEKAKGVIGFSVDRVVLETAPPPELGKGDFME